MSTKITIEISVEGDEQYTAREQAILASLQAHPSQGAAAVVKEPAKVPAPAAAKPAPAAKVEPTTHAKPPAAKAAPAATSPQSGKAAVLDTSLDEAVEAAEPAEEEVEEDLVGGAAYTLEEAVAEATKRVSGGKAAEVKAALATVGAKRVSELKGDAITTFMNALKR